MQTISFDNMPSMIFQINDRLKVIEDHILKPQPTPVTPAVITGSKLAVSFLCERGFEMSMSLFNKATMKGDVICQRFHNKKLLFKTDDLLAWAYSKCVPVNKSDSTLLLAKAANRKLNKKLA